MTAAQRLSFLLSQALASGRTADRRIHHGLQASPTYRLCDHEYDTMEHIIFSCLVSMWCQRKVLLLSGGSYKLNLSTLNMTWVGKGVRAECCWLVADPIEPHWLEHDIVGDQIFAMLVIQISKSKEFDTLFILITWQLWKEQNARVSVASKPSHWHNAERTSKRVMCGLSQEQNN